MKFDNVATLNRFTLFKEANQLCRQTYFNKWSIKLGDITKVYTQIVSGFNYKIVYLTAWDKKVQCIVYTQVWTNTV